MSEKHAWLFVGSGLLAHAIRKDQLAGLLSGTATAVCGIAGYVRKTHICLEAHEVRRCKNCERKLSKSIMEANE